MCVIKQSRKRLRLISPIEGTITKVNKGLMKNVELIKEDPYQKGWLYIIKPAVDVSHIKQEMEAAVFTQDWIHREIEKLSDFVVHEFPSKSDLEEMLRKEKIPLVGILKNMDGLAWQKFQENFLR